MVARIGIAWLVRTDEKYEIAGGVDVDLIGLVSVPYIVQQAASLYWSDRSDVVRAIRSSLRGTDAYKACVNDSTFFPSALRAKPLPRSTYSCLVCQYPRYHAWSG